MKANECDFKRWTPAGLELLAKVLRKAKEEASRRKADTTLVRRIEMHERAMKIDWSSKEVR